MSMVPLWNLKFEDRLVKSLNVCVGFPRATL